MSFNGLQTGNKNKAEKAISPMIIAVYFSGGNKGIHVFPITLK